MPVVYMSLQDYEVKRSFQERVGYVRRHNLAPFQLWINGQVYDVLTSTAKRDERKFLEAREVERRAQVKLDAYTSGASLILEPVSRGSQAGVREMPLSKLQENWAVTKAKREEEAARVVQIWKPKESPYVVPIPPEAKAEAIATGQTITVYGDGSYHVGEEQQKSGAGGVSLGGFAFFAVVVLVGGLAVGLLLRR